MKMDVITHFECLNCNNKFDKSYKWELSRALCPKCGKEVITQTIAEDPVADNKVIKRRPLTEWEKKKLVWYRDETKWRDDIQGRRVLPNGNIGVFDAKGNLKEVREQRRGFQR